MEWRGGAGRALRRVSQVDSRFGEGGPIHVATATDESSAERTYASYRSSPRKRVFAKCVRRAPPSVSSSSVRAGTRFGT